jgi:hypothetical protein
VAETEDSDQEGENPLQIGGVEVRIGEYVNSWSSWLLIRSSSIRFTVVYRVFVKAQWGRYYHC